MIVRSGPFQSSKVPPHRDSKLQTPSLEGTTPDLGSGSLGQVLAEFFNSSSADRAMLTISLLLFP